jgi:hypothetical protein
VRGLVTSAVAATAAASFGVSSFYQIGAVAGSNWVGGGVSAIVLQTEGLAADAGGRGDPGELSATPRLVKYASRVLDASGCERNAAQDLAITGGLQRREALSSRRSRPFGANLIRNHDQLVRIGALITASADR